MKKIISGLLFCAIAVSFTNCKKAKDAIDCNVEINKLNAAKAAYDEYDGFSKELCANYKAALENMLNGACKSTLPESVRNTFETHLAELGDCNPR